MSQLICEKFSLFFSKHCDSYSISGGQGTLLEKMFRALYNFHLKCKLITFFFRKMNVLRDRDMRVKFFLRWARTIKQSGQNHCFFRQVSCREHSFDVHAQQLTVCQKSQSFYTLCWRIQSTEKMRERVEQLLNEFSSQFIYGNLPCHNFLTREIVVNRGLSFLFVSVEIWKFFMFQTLISALRQFFFQTSGCTFI